MEDSKTQEKVDNQNRRPLTQEHQFWTSYEQEVKFYYIQTLRLNDLSVVSVSITLTNTILVNCSWELLCHLYMCIVIAFWPTSQKTVGCPVIQFNSDINYLNLTQI